MAGWPGRAAQGGQPINTTGNRGPRRHWWGQGPRRRPGTADVDPVASMGGGSLRPGRPASSLYGIGTHSRCWGRWGPARAPDGWPVHPGRAPIDQMTLFHSQKVPEMAGELRPSEMRLSASLNHYLPHNSSEKSIASFLVPSVLQPIGCATCGVRWT